MNWPNTPLTRRLRIRYPIIQAPMAGGPTTPQLVAAVSNGGGLGSLAAGYLKPKDIKAAIAEIHDLTDRPFAVNLFVPGEAIESPGQVERANTLLAPFRSDLGLPQLADGPHHAQRPAFAAQLEAILDEGVKIVSFTFGVPTPEAMATLREAGVFSLGTATHLLEAIVLEECGVDAIVAQGIEAGGHRGGFLGVPEHVAVGTMALVPLLAGYVSVPVVAAGGIMNGRGIAAAMALGAAAAQMGTAFLRCPESGTSGAHRDALREGTEIATTLTRAFSGKSARGLRNRLVDELESHQRELPEYPIQSLLTEDIRHAALRHNRSDFLPLWSGQGCPMGIEAPAGELLKRWAIEAAETITRL